MTESSADTAVRLTRAERLGILAVWVGLGLMEATKAYVQRRVLGQPIPWSTALIGNLPWWLVWAALTPAVVALARRVRPMPRARKVVLHVAAAIAFSLVHHVVTGTLYYLTNTRGLVVAIGGPPAAMTLLRQIMLFFTGYFVLNVLTYGAVLGGYLALDFYKRYREGELRATRLEADMHAARMTALRMELNPHFLFNTLNAVTGLIATGGGDDAIRMLARLSELLRSSLEDSADAEIPLERELDLLGTYLEIERIRFGERLHVTIDADAAARETLVPPLLLQPIVENAVRHGVALHEGPASLTIGATADDGWLDVVVSNTGPPPGTAPVRSSGTGVGLENTRARLRHFYGADATLELHARAEGGHVVRIRAPLRSHATP